jgi:phytanoyl-CoA hydroxylase
MMVKSIFPDCPSELSKEQLASYWENGYLAFEQALSPDEVEEARNGLSNIVKSLAFNDEAAEFRPGSVDKSNHAGASFWSRTSPCFIQLEPGYEPNSEKIDELELKVRKAMYFQDEAPIFKSICTSHSRIQGVVKSILGETVELYQSMALIKPAGGGVEKPWHQDNAYFSVQNLDQVIGTWIALDDATVSNGCMHLLEKGHRTGPLRHHHTFDCEIVSGRIDPARSVPIELKAGGMLIFHGNLPHQTPANSSSNRRRALQFHYKNTSNPIISKEDYFAVFKESDGTPASCDAAVQKHF